MDTFTTPHSSAPDYFQDDEDQSIETPNQRSNSSQIELAETHDLPKKYANLS